MKVLDIARLLLRIMAGLFGVFLFGEVELPPGARRPVRGLDSAPRESLDSQAA